MTSLSRIIKSNAALIGNAPNKVLGLKSFPKPADPVVQEEKQSFPLPEEVFKEATEKANQLIMKAKEEALLIREGIEAERRAWEEEKRIQGEKAYREGYDAGFEQGKNQYRELIQLAKNTADSASAEYHQTIEEAERTILDLSMAVAEKIIAYQLYEDDDTYFAFVRNAIKESREYRNIELHIHPAHYEHILRNKNELASLFPRETALYIYPDEELSEGDCYIESSSGRLTASVDVQLEQIRKTLLELLEEQR